MVESAENPAVRRAQGLNLAARAVGLALLMLCEKSFLNHFVDFDAAQSASGLGDLVRVTQHAAFRFLVSLAIALALFTYVQGNKRFAEANQRARHEPIRWQWLVIHVVLFAPLIPLSYSLYGGHGWALPFGVIVSLWLSFALCAALAAAAAVAPWSLWRLAGGSFGILWAYAGGAAFFAAAAMQWTQKLWAPTARVTFDLVKLLLTPFVPTLLADPTRLVLSTDRFAVQVAEVCSGLEGMGLMLAFCSVWLLLFRREYVFPRALLLIPAGLVLMFFLNALRIAGLLMIGHAGYPEVAVFGFHSQAGWIAFNIAACAVVVVSRRSRWLSRPRDTAKSTVGENPTVPYLVPFLTIIAAGMLASAASGGFEVLYPLRLAAGALALWALRARLAALDWRFTWRGPVVGLIVAGLWLVAVQYLLTAMPMPRALLEMQPLARISWISARVLAAVVIVPMAEELAFRGYLLRRIQSAEFDSVRFESVSWFAVLVSSLVFGLAHGALWLPGLIAGLFFGSVAKFTGRFGEAVAAHATSNALLAGWVLIANQWQSW